MKYKIIAMDFDGTLLTDDKKVSSKTEKVLRELKKEGYYIVGATARTLDGLRDVVPIDMFNYIIINNGVSIYNPEEDTDEWMGFLEQQEAEKITKAVEEYATQIDIISGNKYYIYKQKKKSNLPFIIDIDSVSEVHEKIARMNIFLKSGEEARKHYKWISTNFPDINCFVMQDSKDDRQWLIINPQNINKSHTLKHLGDNLGVSSEEMIFFGDGLNDLEIIESVGLGVAMGNALPEVKDQAKAITTSNEEDGIAEFVLTLKKKR